MPLITIAINDSATGYPLGDVLIEVTTDSGGANVVTSGRTSAAGVVALTLAAGTYYFLKTKSGFAGAVQTVVVGATAASVAGTMTAASTANSITGQDVAQFARRMLADEKGAPRWSDEFDLLPALTDALHEVYQARPDAFFSGTSVPSFTAPTALGDTLQLGLQWRSRLAEYVVARMLLSEDSDTQNKPLANVYLELFNKGLGR